jgi:hypothetical protein
MIALNGIYKDGIVKLDKKISGLKSVKVIVTFPDEEIQNPNGRLTITDFSFSKAREKSRNFKGSLSEAIIEERRVAL